MARSVERWASFLKSMSRSQWRHEEQVGHEGEVSSVQ